MRKALLNSFKKVSQKRKHPALYLHDDGKTPRKLEQLSEHDPHFHTVFNNSKLSEAVTELYGEEIVLYKDRAVTKLPNTPGNLVHQDMVVGFDFVTSFISAAISLTEQTIDNGCLEIYNGPTYTALNPLKFDCPCVTGGACLCPYNMEISGTDRTYTPITTGKGAVIFFDGFIPHKSGPNTTKNIRTLLYSIYNKKSEGDNYTEFYDYMFKNK